VGKKTNKTHESEPQVEEFASSEMEQTDPEVLQQESVEEPVAGPSLEEQLNADLEQARDEAKQQQDLYLRAMAEMENLRKRTQREKEELGKFANENILRDILPVIDNLERAVEHAEQTENHGGLLEGVQMTLVQFSQVLSRFGVEPVISLGAPFDPAVHQAIGQLESDEYPPNTVAQEMQKGYLLNERLLRPAMVMVAKAPTVKEPAADVEQEDTSDQKSSV
jgi:molecular chaperone GrpE